MTLACSTEIPCVSTLSLPNLHACEAILARLSYTQTQENPVERTRGLLEFEAFIGNFVYGDR